VGEFCQIGEHEEFITKIGLRSLEMNTVESRVTQG
jgi:MscS family membrane protein